jgi:hypothetical protein
VESYKFVHNNREYELGESNCSYMLNDEENPVAGIERDAVLRLLAGSEAVAFDVDYYDQPCQSCLAGKKDKEKAFRFLEYHFFIFTKEGGYVISNISREYKNTSYNRLLKEKAVDNSYVASIAVCMECGDYSIEIEQCDV